MEEDNRISETISDDSLRQMLDHVRALRNALPFLETLTPDQRLTLAKLGDKSIGFDEKCSTYMASNPEFLPGFVSVVEVDKDRVLRGQLKSLFAEVSTLARSLDDTLMQLGSEIWRADLAYYNNVGEAAKRGRKGAQTIYDDLRQRFPGARPAKAKPAPVGSI